MSEHDIKDLIQKMIGQNAMHKGMDFYQFIMDALDFVLIEDNYNTFFKDMTTKQRKQQLKALLLEGNKLLFGDNNEYKKHINDLFNEETDIGNVSMLILQFMHIVQEESRTGVYVSGARKSAFVKRSVKCFLRFTDISEEKQADIMIGLDATIKAIILVKNNFLQHVDLKKLKSKCSKCLPCF